MTDPRAAIDNKPLTRDDVRVIDTDTHFSESYDLWTSRVPEKMKDLVPHVVRDADNKPIWLMNGEDVLMSLGGAGSVIRKDGTRQGFWEFDLNSTMTWDEVSPASYDLDARLEMMDASGIWAQIVYPNLTGFGAHKIAGLPDQKLAELIVSTYNDAMAEMQEASNNRFFPQAMVPFWNIDAAVREAERASRKLNMRGITMCSEPHAGGLPDLTDHHWNPLWEVCTDLEMPINLHVGAGEFGIDAFLKGVWPGLDRYGKMVVGAVNIEMHNAQVLSNLLVSGLLDRYPKLKWVSVESGIGWVPFVLERLEYQLLEELPPGVEYVMSPPRASFQRQVYVCFWYEQSGPSRLLDCIGFDNVLFETDFPHPTCLGADAVEHGLKVLEPWGPEVQRKVLQDNAAALYKIPLPPIKS